MKNAINLYIMPIFRTHYNNFPLYTETNDKPSLCEQSHDVTIRQLLDRATNGGFPIPTPSLNQYDENEIPNFHKMDFAEIANYAQDLEVFFQVLCIICNFCKVHFVKIRDLIFIILI